MSTVTAADVREHLTPGDDGPPVLTPGSDQPDPWHVALDEAVRNTLLSMEAHRLGLGASAAGRAGSRPELTRALINHERGRVAWLNEKSISDVAARAWFDEHPTRFQDVEAAHVAWARLGDGATARRLLDHSPSQTEAQFLQTARKEKAAAVGVATLDHAGRGADVLVARAVFALARQGATGLVEGEGGAWWLVRLGKVELRSPPWDKQMAAQVKAAMAWDREQTHLVQLAKQLEKRWAVVVHEDRVEASRPTGLELHEVKS